MDDQLLAALYEWAHRGCAFDAFLDRLRAVSQAEAVEWWRAPTVDPNDEMELVARCGLDLRDDPRAAKYPDGPEGMAVERLRLGSAEIGQHLALLWLPASTSPCRIRALLQSLAPHAERALALRASLRRTAADGLEHLGSIASGLRVAVLLFDTESSIVWQNRHCEAVLEATAPHLVIRNNSLCAPESPRAQDQLERGLLAVCRAHRQPGQGRTQLAISIPRPESALPCIVWLSRLEDQRDRIGSDRACVAATVTDPHVAACRIHPQLFECFGLTHTEARIAEQLATGLAPKVIANAMQISEGTVRQHVKMILQKTGARRQSELVQLLVMAVPCAPHTGEPAASLI